MLKINFYACANIDHSLIGFTVIMARLGGKWVFCRHSERATWEIPGGHVDPGESVEDAAKRELYEETGALSYSMEPVCIYSVSDGSKTTYGQLYYAEMEEMGELPGFEICEIMLSDDLPDNLTYPQIQPLLYNRILEFVGEIS